MKPSLFFISTSGCLLPVLLFTNVFFGWMVFRPAVWLTISVALLCLFLLHSYALTRRIAVLAQRRRNVIDVQGEVINDKETQHGDR